MLVNSIDTGARTLTSAMNFALHPNNQLDIDGLEQNDNRSFFIKYGLGAPGLLAGGVLGAMVAFAIGTVRLINQNRLSFNALAGSCFNALVESPVYPGLAGDLRTRGEKAAGFLGYVLASPLVPLSYVFYMAKKTLLISVFFGLGVLCSPLVALKKCFEAPRFPERRAEGDLVIRDQNDVHQAFRDVYSSLTFYGKFNPDYAIVRNAEGNHGKWYGIRKVFTFNMDTITERTLNFMLGKYNEFEARNPGGMRGDFFTDGNMLRWRDEMKAYYRRTRSFMTTDAEQADLEREVDNITEFVKEYVTAHFVRPEAEVRPPQNMYAQPNNWAAGFWGKGAPGGPNIPDEVAPLPEAGFAYNKI